MKHIDQIRGDIKVGTGRRVGHSFLTALRNIGPSSKSAHIARALTNDANAVSAMGIGVGAAQVAGTLSEAAAVAGLVAVVAGPQVAITAGIVGIALIVYNSYTNREEAHEELYGYCWNMLTPTAPTKRFGALPDLCKAAAAGMRLIEEGAKQMAEQCTKLEKATQAFVKFHADISKKIQDVQSAARAYNLAHQVWLTDKITVGVSLNDMKDRHRRFKEAKNQVLKEINAAAEVDGAIFEMVRRCQHYSEYLQAPHIVSMYYKSQANNELSSEAKNFGVEDFFKDWPKMVEERELFKKLEAVYAKFSDLSLYEDNSLNADFLY